MKKTLLLFTLVLCVSVSTFAEKKLFDKHQSRKKIFEEKIRSHSQSVNLSLNDFQQKKQWNIESKSTSASQIPTLTKRSYWQINENNWYGLFSTKLLVENGEITGSLDLSYDLLDTNYRRTITRDDFGRIILEYIEAYDTLSALFKPSSKISTSYSIDGLTTTIITESYNIFDNTWYPNSKAIYVENDRAEWIGYSYYTYVSNDWNLQAKYTTRIEYLNPNSNKITLQIDSAYVNNSMMAEYKMEIEYDANEQEQIIRYYGLGNNGLHLESIDSVFYSNFIPNEVIVTSFTELGTPEYKEKYYNLVFDNYTSQNPLYDQQINSYLSAIFLSNNWQESGRFTRNSIDNFGSYYELFEEYIGNNYRESYSYLERFNSYGERIENNEMNFNQDSNKLVLVWGYKQLLTYNANNNLSERIVQYYAQDLGVYVNEQKNEYSDYVLINTGLASKKINSLAVYPNPVSNNTITLKHDNFNNQEASIKIIDLNGKEVQSDKILLNGLETYVNIEDVHSGMYIIQLHTTNKFYQTKFIKP